MINWAPLRQALADCRAAGMRVPVWWRDDDATEPTSALDRLERLSRELGIPVHLAIVPKHASHALAEYVARTDAFESLVHGWAHTNHAGPNEKKSEFGSPRDSGRAELHEGFQRSMALFSKKPLPVFVPPWNRMDDSYFDALAATGYRALSSFSPRTSVIAFPNLARINCHIDPIDWRGTRGLVAPEQIIETAVARIRARLDGSEDSLEPMGYLTHHLVHTAEIWEFSANFLNELLQGGAVIQPLSPLLEQPE